MAPLPTPTYERDVNRLVQYYKTAFTQIADRLKVIPASRGLEKVQAESLLTQTMFILQELDASTKSWCDDVIHRAFADGQNRVLQAVGNATTLADAAGTSDFLLARERVEALINDTYSDLLMATQNTERKIKQLVKNTVGETMRTKALQQLGRRSMRNAVVAELTQKGLSARLDGEAWVGIVDRAGRRWNLSTYAEMVVRTKLMQAHIEGTRVEGMQRGVDLAVVSSHNAKDACRSYEGMIISLNGLTAGYRTYDQLRAIGNIFHPNCQHHVSPVRDVALLPQSVREKHEQAMKAQR
ncbi:phage minor capsid protein [Heliophilum fasciatum]|uniref:Minor capsid protein 2 n=1 Tax=Heliophilum fasciatum TaxID=35700 RepID=A0A4R2RCY7_9FIRM|nr:phage minor capsid protein [Heliophilum fasciatum]MCW2279100.1 hypothetical protein [Heliophilum fasciatum]TCP61272.1 minor capsid protein 2 [Heliophilum fasciatum]